MPSINSWLPLLLSLGKRADSCLLAKDRARCRGNRSHPSFEESRGRYDKKSDDDIQSSELCSWSQHPMLVLRARHHTQHLTSMISSTPYTDPVKEAGLHYHCLV